jgi:thiol-disulfide isomerase/thioredoxin
MHHPKSWARWLLGLVMAASVAGALRGAAGADEPAADRKPPVDLLAGGSGWINSAPIRLDELRGKVVLLDFWTYCCINCHHVLPDLARLEQKYKDELVVIGVHTAKFFAERDTENIRKKVREYQIKHPVINDANQVLWTRFEINSWPTLFLLDARGNPRARISGEGNKGLFLYDAKGEGRTRINGEGNYDVLDQAIGKLVHEAREKKELNETPVKFFPESEKSDDGPLSFPGKVLADAEGKRLFIADTGHNRIVQTDLSGKGATAIGAGSPGLADGSYDKAQFNRPQGMCLVEGILYVADTENHAIRAVDLKAKTVATVAGTGQQTHNYRAHGPGKTTSLTSPWDLVLIPGTKALAVAMAGQHQIWRYDIPSGLIGVWAGTGEENIGDSDDIGRARFAQPSGLATDGHALFVADSEVSAIREIAPISPGRKPHVRTIVGQGLFVFDDVDGKADEVRLQHCLGVSYGNDRLYIADTYNNKVKECDPKTRTVETLAGSGQPGLSDEPARFDEPGGLSLAGSTLYVADTNNHAIRAVDVKQKTVRTLELASLGPPAPPSYAPTFPNAKVIASHPVRIAPGKALTLDVTLPLDDDDKLSDQAPMPYLVETPGRDDALARDKAGRRVDRPARRFTVAVPLARDTKPGDTLQVKFSVSAFVCNTGSNLCRIKSFVWDVPVTFGADGKKEITLAAK